MRAKLLILPLLLMFTMGLCPLGARGQRSSDPGGLSTNADGRSGGDRPAGGPPAAPSGSAPGPGNAASPPGPGYVNPWQQGPNVNPAITPRPQALVAAAVRTLEGHNSVYAQIRHEVDLFGRSLAGFGSYLEQRQGRNRLVRLELRIQLGDQTSSLLQVCDGRFLWTYRKLLDNGKLSRIDVARATWGLERARTAPEKGDMDMLPGLGGLPKVLRGLHAAFDFTSARKGRLGQLPVWRLRGQWKPQQLAKILPEQEEAIQAGEAPDLTMLPQHLPDQVILLLGQEDWFPYRIEYRRALSKKAIRPGSSASRAIVTMEMFHVDINGPIDRNSFIYNPGDLEFTDQTESFLESLGVEE